ncbi:MAG: DUF3459 domain-containing protein, partial [Bacteroidota bacterium]
LREGTLLPYREDLPQQLVVFYRALGDQKYMVVHNVSGRKQSIPTPLHWQVLFMSKPQVRFTENSLVLPPYSVSILSD